MPGTCRPCGLWKPAAERACHYKISGEGNPMASVIIVGEALGQQEEEQGRPFVGRAGWVLNKCLSEADIARSEVWITNSVRCRPTNAMGKNRKPSNQEMDFCRGWLDDEIASMPQAQVIVALGDVATRQILSPHVPTGGVLENQGRVIWSERYQKWVVLTLHPAWILRKPGESFWLTTDLAHAVRIAMNGHPAEPVKAQVRVVRTMDDAFEMKEAILHNAQRLFWDWETNGLHLTKAIGFCVSFCYEAGKAWVLPRYGANMMPFWSRSQLTTIDREVLQPVFLSDIPKGGHHVAFDGCITKTTVGVWPVNIETDTMVLHHLTGNHLGERAHGLKRMSVVYTEYGRYDDELDQWLIDNGYTDDGKADHEFLYKAPDPLVHQYNGTDSVVPFEVEPLLVKRAQEADLWDCYINERMPLIREYMEMDRAGVRISRPRLDRLSDDLALCIKVVDNQLATIVGRELNVNSPKQVIEYLYHERGLPILGRSESGAPSTKEEFLKDLVTMDPAVQPILDGRGYRKLKGAFVDGSKDNPGGIRAVVDWDDRARMSTITTAIETFRLATRKPFPIHTIPRPLVLWSCPDGHGMYLYKKCCERAIQTTLSIRALIIPDDGMKIVAGDFVQQEYALAAIISGQRDMEEAMLDRGEDAHEFVMKMLAGRTKFDYGEKVGEKFLFRDKNAEADYKNIRSQFKQLNFAILYRAGAKKVSRSLTTDEKPVDETDAARIIEDYYERLPDIKWWQYRTIKSLRETGRVVSPFNTFRILPGIWSPDRFDQYEAERQGCNFPVQVSGYHVMARGSIKLAGRWRGKLPLRAPFPARILFTLHDEVVTQIREDLVEEGESHMHEDLEQAHPELVGGCGIPRGIKLDTKATDAWGGVFDLPEEFTRSEPVLV